MRTEIQIIRTAATSIYDWAVRNQIAAAKADPSSRKDSPKYLAAVSYEKAAYHFKKKYSPALRRVRRQGKIGAKHEDAEEGTEPQI